MTIAEAFGTVLKKYRKKLNLSQEELSYRCNLDRSFISLLERGKRNATIETLFKVCLNLNITPSNFIKEIEDLLHNRRI